MEVNSQLDLIELITIAVSLFFAAGFSGSETAITSLGALRAKHILDQEKKAVRPLNLWLQHPGRVLTTILIYNNLFHILASAVATDFATRHFANQAIGIATGTMTFLILIFVEVIPKSFAKSHAEQLAIPALRAVYGLYWVSLPFAWGFSEFATKVLSTLGPSAKKSPPITEEELEFLVNVGERAGVIEETKKEMIVSVFDFDETKVREVMTPRPDVKWLGADTTFAEALALGVETGMSRIPICDEGGIDHVIGVLLVKDLLKFAHDARIDKNKNFSIKGVMREPFYVPESKPVMDVFKDLKSSKNHIAIVVDEHGGTAGLVTLEDILEEIVGDIQDEHDKEEAEIKEINPGQFEIAGSCNLDEFFEHFAIDESTLGANPDESSDTLAGWIVAKLGELPEVGKKVEMADWCITVKEVARQRIMQVSMEKLDRTSKTESTT